MATLYLSLKGQYFDQIKSGEKVEEFRLVTPYWQRRLDGRTYDQIILARGYPKKSAAHLRISRAWRGVRKTIITHPHFGPDPVAVYAIRVNPARAGLLEGNSSE